MKPLKDLAEHLAKDNRVNLRALERLNYYLEAIRCTIAQAQDHAAVGSSNKIPYLLSQCESYIKMMDETAIVPRASGLASRATPNNCLLGGKSLYQLEREEIERINRAAELYGERLSRAPCTQRP